MTAIRASAPGKLVILGEYAVLDGAPALVMAVDRRARADVGGAPGGPGRVETRSPAPAVHGLEPGRASGVAVVDLVLGADGRGHGAAGISGARAGAGRDAVAPAGADTRLGPEGAAPAGEGLHSAGWRALIDTAPFYAGGAKLGLGSSAAALCAFAGAWRGFLRASGLEAQPPRLGELIELHRRFQPGGSGLDVAASFTGGVVTYRLGAGRDYKVGSVRLPNSVGFAGIFAGRSASTPDFVSRFRNWGRERPEAAAEFRRQMGGVAEVGCEAASSNDARGLLEAIAEYGRGLEALGRAIGAEIMTSEHAAIAEEARRAGVVYKVSGAGGGDLGLAFSDDAQALADFEAAASERGFRAVELGIDRAGLVVEEQR